MSGKHYQPSKSKKRKLQDRYINFALNLWFESSGEEPFTVRELLSNFIENKDKYKSRFRIRNIPTTYVVSRYISTLPFIERVCDARAKWKINGDKYVMDREV